MKNYTLILILNVLLLQGCGIFGGGDNASNTQDQPIPTPTPETQEDVTPETQTPEDESDILGESEGRISTRSPLPSGLIPSINPQNRQAELTTGKSDPFAVTPVQPIINYPAPPTPPGKPTAPPQVLLNQDVSGQGSYCTRSFDPESTEYVKPEPTEARSVLVSGILNLDGENVAIIKTGEYDYSYSVRAGSNLYGGQVFVKNINSRQPSPSVILEQYGEEIIRRLGEPPETEVSQPGQDDGFTILQPKGPEVFGLINGLMLTKITLEQDSATNSNKSNSAQPALTARVVGTLCNDSTQVIQVKHLILQIEDSEGVVLDSQEVDLGRRNESGSTLGFTLKPSQKAEFSATISLRKRLAGDIHVKLREWY